MKNCIFCKIINGELPAKFVYEDEHIVAFPDINPKASTHVLVVPKIHFKNLNEMKPIHEKLMLHIIQKIPNIASLHNLSGYRTIINTGRAGGQEIDHFHLHILGGTRLPGF